MNNSFICAHLVSSSCIMCWNQNLEVCSLVWWIERGTSLKHNKTARNTERGGKELSGQEAWWCYTNCLWSLYKFLLISRFCRGLKVFCELYYWMASEQGSPAVWYIELHVNRNIYILSMVLVKMQYINVQLSVALVYTDGTKLWQVK